MSEQRERKREKEKYLVTTLSKTFPNVRTKDVFPVPAFPVKKTSKGQVGEKEPPWKEIIIIIIIIICFCFLFFFYQRKERQKEYSSSYTTKHLNIKTKTNLLFNPTLQIRSKRRRNGTAKRRRRKIIFFFKLFPNFQIKISKEI